MKTKILIAATAFVAGGFSVVLAVMTGHGKIDQNGFVFDSHKRV